MKQTEPLTSDPGQGASGAILAGWISRGELARELGLTEDTLRRWEDRRIGPVCVRAGRRVYYRRTAVQDWLAAQEAAKQPRQDKRPSWRQYQTRPLFVSRLLGCRCLVRFFRAPPL